NRAYVSKRFYNSDVVLVPLEDGDRTEALIKINKKVIAIDLNPLSRTSQKATITIVNNVVRAIPEMIKIAKNMKKKIEENEYREKLENELKNFDNKKNLKEILKIIKKNFQKFLSL
ncbi:MAG: phosphopantothenate/pantothenate synthetase family protein, partial [Candidatus Altarchaeaceae archaeon]